MIDPVKFYLDMNFFVLCICLLVAAVSAKPSLNFDKSRIVGGVDAEPHAYPYHLSFRFEVPIHEIDIGVCGGVILNESWAVTAAHCITAFTNFTETQFGVIAGRHNISLPFEPNQQHSVIKQFYIHENYTSALASHDIALIELETPFVFNEFVQPLNLPEPGSVASGVATVTGWGSISYTTVNVSPDILQTVTIPIIPNDVCNDILISLGAGNIGSSDLCTGPLTGNKAPCSGDSGGPLAQNGELIGVLAWGFVPCGQIDRPAVYVNIAEYISWINDTINSAEI